MTPVLSRARTPIVRGFYPDPTVCRVGDDYYLAHSASSTVRAGQSVPFRALAQVPPQAGKIVSAGWHFTGTGSFAPNSIGRPKHTLHLEGRHRFTEAGRYYVALKVASSRSGLAEPFAQVENLDWVRVVVRP